MTQPPTDPSGDGSGTSGSSDQPTYGQPSYGQPSYGQPTSDQPSYGQPAYGHQDQQPAYGQPAYGQPAYGQQQQPGWSQPSAAQYGADVRQSEQGYAQVYGQKPKTGMAIASLVLGIIALLASPFPIGSYVGFVLAVLAVIFGIVGVRRQAGKGMAVAGLILGGVALVVSIIASIFWTQALTEFIEIGNQCADETGSTSGPAFERCVTDRVESSNPFA